MIRSAVRDSAGGLFLLAGVAATVCPWLGLYPAWAAMAGWCVFMVAMVKLGAGD